LNNIPDRYFARDHEYACFGRSSWELFAPGQRLTVRLLHPLDPEQEQLIVFDLTRLNCSHEEGFLNFMTSAQLDEYCIDDHYFIA
jgi:hypothetical protein